MNHRTEIGRALLSAILGALLGSSAAYVLALGMGATVKLPLLIGIAGVSAALGGLFACSGAIVVIAALLVAGGTGVAVATHFSQIKTLTVLLQHWRGQTVDVSVLALAQKTLIYLIAWIGGLLFAGLIAGKTAVLLAPLIYLTATLVGYGQNGSIPLTAVLPGLVACIASLALGAGMFRDDGTPFRVLVPALLAAVIAFMFVPAENVKWKPLADAAEKLRAIFNEYAGFSQERVAFSLNEEGYNYAREVDGTVYTLLGGPAEPDQTPTLKVETDSPVLLRGSIRTGYTGYSWTDALSKSRYFYYDVAHISTRNAVFETKKSTGSAFESVELTVTALEEGTSSLFIPGRLDHFSMSLSSAVCYNTLGELFLTRSVQEGDSWTATGSMPVYGNALRSATISGANKQDKQYAEIVSDYTELPKYVEQELRDLTVSITEDCECDYDRVMAIETYLQTNCRYTLEPDYPPMGRDFASYFVLESKEGYCTYFATAMAVMARICGIPSRYIEGYYARPDESGTVTLTGADAHAWVEIYFKGLGWVSFDPSGSRGSDHESEGSNSEDEDSPQQEETTQPETEDPELEEQPLPQTDAPTDAQMENAENTIQPWMWILLVLLLLLIAALIAWLRLRATDPVRMSLKMKDAAACMMLYRANLTLLSRMGLGIGGGESIRAHLTRVKSQLKCEAFFRFADAIEMNRYANTALNASDAKNGRDAYKKLLKALKPFERVKYLAHRMLHGIGDYENLP